MFKVTDLVEYRAPRGSALILDRRFVIENDLHFDRNTEGTTSISFGSELQDSSQLHRLHLGDRRAHIKRSLYDVTTSRTKITGIPAPEQWYQIEKVRRWRRGQRRHVISNAIPHSTTSTSPFVTRGTCLQ